MSYYHHTAEARDDSSLERHQTRLYTLRPHFVQSQFYRSRARFNIVPAGRRSGKTEISKRKLVRTSVAPYKLGGSRFPDPKYFCGAPTRDQAKRIFWNDIKVMTRELGLWRKEPSESQLIVSLWPNVEIHVIGLDKPERIEGHPWDGGILDEYGNMKKEAWPENVRPALADRRGWCDLIGVPEGRNHYYDEWLKAKADETGYRLPFHWFSSDILPPEEIQEAKEDLDELTYRQEYEGSFINFSGQAYYNFNENLHVDKLEYNPKRDIDFCFDFNVSPGTATVIQEQWLPTSEEEETWGDGVIGEVYIPRNSNTLRVCDRLIKDFGRHKARIFCYGDYTGGSKGTANVLGSDWQLIKQKLWGHFGKERVFFRVKPNPRERERVNSVNSRLLTMSGNVHLMVDPNKAPKTIRDFEGVRLLEGGSGEIDKKADPELSHLTDGIGYRSWILYPVKKQYATSGQKHWK